MWAFLQLISTTSGHSPTEQKLRDWLKVVDQDGDGLITRQELRDALRVTGKHFKHLRAWMAVSHADLNQNHMVDGETEIEMMAEYLQKKHWGIKIINR